jgi:hypothetical protein
MIGDHDGAQAWWAAEGKIGVAEAKLDCGAGRKHLKYGQTRVGTALIAECATVTPDSREGKGAKELLEQLKNGGSVPVSEREEASRPQDMPEQWRVEAQVD